MYATIRAAWSALVDRGLRRRVSSNLHRVHCDTCRALQDCSECMTFALALADIELDVKVAFESGRRAHGAHYSRLASGTRRAWDDHMLLEHSEARSHACAA